MTSFARVNRVCLVLIFILFVSLTEDYALRFPCDASGGVSEDGAFISGNSSSLSCSIGSSGNTVLR